MGINFRHLTSLFGFAIILAVGLQGTAAQAQCSPTNPACQPPSGGQGGSSGGGNVGVQVDVGGVVKGIGKLIKKKKKKPVVQADVATAPVQAPAAPAQPQVIFRPSPEVVQAIPKTPRRSVIVTPRMTKPVVVATKPRIIPRAVAKSTARKAAPATAAVIAAPIVAAPIIEPEVSEVIAPPEIVTEVPPTVIAPAAIEAPTPTATEPQACAPGDDCTPNNYGLYAIIAAVAAGLGAAGYAAKAMFTPKVSLDCTLTEGSSRMESMPSIVPPEVTFNVALPEFAVTTPDALSIIS